METRCNEAYQAVAGNASDGYKVSEEMGPLSLEMWHQVLKLNQCLQGLIVCSFATSAKHPAMG